jgi:hypothetical protein
MQSSLDVLLITTTRRYITYPTTFLNYWKTAIFKQFLTRTLNFNKDNVLLYIPYYKKFKLQLGSFT